METTNKSVMTKIKEFILTPTYSFRNVILSLLLGFVVAYVVIIAVYGIDGGNHILRSLFEQDFLNSNTVASLVSKFAVLGLAGLAVAFGMKAGILNIGVSGQMTAGGLVGYILIDKSDWMQNVDHNAGVLAIAFFVVIAVSVLTSLVAGVLKAFFKVNEVISTIMINWIVVYFVKLNANSEKGDSMIVNGGDTRFVAGNEWAFAIVGVAILIFAAVAAWLYLSKTKGGFKLIATGHSQDVAKYAGYNSKVLLLKSFIYSGVLAGLAGYVYFFLSYNEIPGIEAPIQEGFTGIAVALVAMVNPLAIVPSAMLFALLTGPVDGIVVAGFAPDVVQVFSGVITYFVAITTLFLYLRPINWMKMKINTSKQKNTVNETVAKEAK